MGSVKCVCVYHIYPHTFFHTHTLFSIHTLYSTHTFSHTLTYTHIRRGGNDNGDAESIPDRPSDRDRGLPPIPRRARQEGDHPQELSVGHKMVREIPHRYGKNDRPHEGRTRGLPLFEQDPGEGVDGPLQHRALQRLHRMGHERQHPEEAQAAVEPSSTRIFSRKCTSWRILRRKWSSSSGRTWASAGRRS